MPTKKTTRKTASQKPAPKTATTPGKAPISTAEIKESILSHLEKTLARDTNTATKRDWWIATSKAVQDRILSRYIDTMGVHNEENVRRVYYLSLEYLMGRLFRNNIFNAGVFDQVSEALGELGLDIDELAAEENDMGLGNGGLGRLAACFLDSLATLDLPAIGYGIHYEFGLFKQEFENGYQVERPDNWEKFGNPWEIMRPEYMQTVNLYGRVENRVDEKGDFKPVWVDTRSINGVPFDIPICGYGTKTVNFLRLWESKASEEFDFQVFNEGGYVEAVHDKAVGETVSKVLYPNDATESGKELRLVQQYFFVCCSLQDIMRRFLKKESDWSEFPSKVAIQLNDTHPAVATAELMRILVDEQGMPWDEAWGITRKTFAYTNHTLLPEALEKWSVPLFERVLPRHLQIIYEINRRFLEEEVEAMWPGDSGKKSELSIIEEGEPKMIRMAYLSVVASHAVNGVAALHTQLLRDYLFNSFDNLYPGKFQNKTNGITPRRWLLACNPELAKLVTGKVGEDWPKHLDELKGLEAFAEDPDFQKEYLAVKHTKKEQLAAFIEKNMGITVNPSALFDTQVKRLHEYKRQHLNLLHILTLYHRILHNPDYDMVPRVFVFAAKAAPGYYLAKNIIRAINKVGEKINNDPRVKDRIKVAFLPNYGVTLAEKIIPAADLSEQISTAGKEASGTGNMKFALNGALTIGTLDGANVEIGEEVGDDNIFIFGLEVEDVESLRASGYNPWDYYNSNAELKAVLDWLQSDAFTPGESGAFQPLVDSILKNGDPFLVCADYAAYIEAQEKVDAAFRDRERWAKMAILNTARVGKFSSDRTIREYADEIWDLPSVPVK
ncbi:glycogen/starch/alpha-glucan phosphorylase [Puniceicoccus vermicola]|uniref:Alpha-1,4 glucan phosphorylase n=1 Tax=Puniceicoccus vermicola TaxID=388746 RepID=A0A7X1B3F9_9BACT|nr:glycogen/starch/alpha-glucan phosphorylase [Puniceicoccus vermicola]MBC2603705.1 glycogen/starch/alpha-glucan phosphorylase [Puniceicoccus vermicola]